MTFSSSLAFFDHLMNEGALDEAALVAFLAKATSDEGLYLDFKSGQELDKPKDKRNFTVRQYVAAFANSEGGVLVIGVGDDKRLDPITTSHEGKVGGDLTGWAARCVSELVGYLGVPPRFSVIDVAGGKVLLIAVPRAPSLVPVIKDGKQAYFFRVEDEAREVYPHLVSDLLLGRRQAPDLVPSLSDWRVQAGHHESITIVDGGESKRGSDSLTFGGSMTFTNNSLVTANDLCAGVLGFSVKARAEERDPAIPADLRARIVVEAHADGTQHPYALHHKRFTFRAANPGEHPRKSNTVRPFGEVPADLGFQWTVEGRTPRTDELLLALYLVPNGCEPLWFEIGLPLYTEAPKKRNNAILDARVARVVGRRPRVGLVVPWEASA